MIALFKKPFASWPALAASLLILLTAVHAGRDQDARPALASRRLHRAKQARMKIGKPGTLTTKGSPHA